MPSEPLRSRMISRSSPPKRTPRPWWKNSCDRAGFHSMPTLLTSSRRRSPRRGHVRRGCSPSPGNAATLRSSSERAGSDTRRGAVLSCVHRSDATAAALLETHAEVDRAARDRQPVATRVGDATRRPAGRGTAQERWPPAIRAVASRGDRRRAAGRRRPSTGRPQRAARASNGVRTRVVCIRVRNAKVGRNATQSASHEPIGRGRKRP